MSRQRKPKVNAEQIEALVIEQVVKFLNTNVERPHVTFGLHDGKLACFIDLEVDGQQMVFTTDGARTKS